MGHFRHVTFIHVLGRIGGEELMPLQATRVLSVPFEYAMYFDGVDDYVLVSSPSINQLGLSFSVMAWINYFRLLDLSGCAEKYSNVASKRITGVWSNVWVFNIADVRLFSGGLLAKLPPVSLGAFHFVGFSRSLGKSITVFVDDGFISYSDPGTDETNTLPLNIGGNVCFAGEALGYIAQVLAYTRDLSSDEIRQNYNYPDSPVKNGLILWLRADPQYVKDIDGDGILEWLDLSGCNNNSKIYGAQLVQLIRSHSRVIQAQRVLSCAR
jgi:hypothetical protein